MSMISVCYTRFFCSGITLLSYIKSSSRAPTVAIWHLLSVPFASTLTTITACSQECCLQEQALLVHHSSGWFAGSRKNTSNRFACNSVTSAGQECCLDVFYFVREKLSKRFNLWFNFFAAKYICSTRICRECGATVEKLQL